MYLLIGLLGGSSFKIDSRSNIISVISNSPHNSGSIQFANAMFPIVGLITSIPVYLIVIKSNLIQAKMCGKGTATFWSGIFPFLLTIPLQSGSWVVIFMNWASLLFTSTANFILPFLIYVFVQRRNKGIKCF